jgi:uncharacterized protein (DUF1697 family)
MPKYIAFLRAINVGGHTVKMDQLREVFEQCGFKNVETFIASGNVIFDSTSKNPKALEKKIEAALLKAFGYEVHTFLRTPGELTAVENYKPFPDSELKQEKNVLYVGFLSESPGKTSVESVTKLQTPVDALHVNDAEIYWLLRTSFSQSQITGARLEKALGMRTTLRNITTVRRLIAKYC